MKTLFVAMSTLPVWSDLTDGLLNCAVVPNQIHDLEDQRLEAADIAWHSMADQ